jgi:hypothetical protein
VVREAGINAWFRANQVVELTEKMIFVFTISQDRITGAALAD